MSDFLTVYTCISQMRKKANWLSEDNWKKISDRKEMKSKINNAKSERLRNTWKKEYIFKERIVKNSFYSLRTGKKIYDRQNRPRSRRSNKEGEQSTL